MPETPPAAATARGFEPVRSVRLYERIVEQVEEAIARGELRPGERLPSERELVVQFGTSRATVREALRVLESNGVVRSRPGDPNGPEAARASLHSLHDYYASYVPKAERAALEALLDE
ncbi:FadR/GntR family transcriptional regulator [Terrabacter sp. 2RAF25]|uniref:FadR/GntR family transcriptional regulator n=1 Tax=Terrabacter sp. 2RAF25 TaxID=3232998 RepID=UPI003F94AAE4